MKGSVTLCTTMMSDITTKENRGKGMVGTFAYQFLYTFCINYCFMLLYYILHRKWFFCIFLLSKLSFSVILRKNLVLGRTKWPNRPQNDTIGYVRLIVLKLYHKKVFHQILSNFTLHRIIFKISEIISLDGLFITCQC